MNTKDIPDIAVEIWATAQLLPGEGIADGVDRIAALLTRYGAAQPATSDYEEVLADHRRLVRELDVLLNGEEGAAKQASLCDIVAQVQRERIKASQPAASVEPVGGDVAAWHKYIRESLALPDDAPYRFDYYAQVIGLGFSQPPNPSPLTSADANMLRLLSDLDRPLNHGERERLRAIGDALMDSMASRPPNRSSRFSKRWHS